MDIRFPDGTMVRASALSERENNAHWRSYGLYCDPAWQPDWDADLIAWPDFGLPDDWPTAADRIQTAFNRATAGERVEVGCRGGLGRTGTILACMSIVAGVPPDGAVDWVRRHYDPRAVETAEQERWILWFGESWLRSPTLTKRR